MLCLPSLFLLLKFDPGFFLHVYVFLWVENEKRSQCCDWGAEPKLAGGVPGCLGTGSREGVC